LSFEKNAKNQINTKIFKFCGPHQKRESSNLALEKKSLAIPDIEYSLTSFRENPNLKFSSIWDNRSLAEQRPLVHNNTFFGSRGFDLNRKLN